MYTITHDPVHAEMPHAVTVIKADASPRAGTAKALRSSSRTLLSMSRRWSISRSRRSRVTRLAARKQEPHPDALPEWIKPQLTEVVREAPEGPDWLHEINSTATGCTRGSTGEKYGC